MVISSTTKDIIDALNKIAQVIALVVAGIWGWHIYNRTSKPGLETRSEVHVDADWSEGPNGDYCLGSFTVNLKNDGLRAFDVTKYSVRVWVFSDAALMNERLQAEPERPVFINYDEVEKGQSFYDEPDVSDAGLVGHYSPGVSGNLSWDFLFKKDKGKAVYFSFKPTIDGVPASRPSWKADAVCRSDRLDKKDQTKSSEK